LEFTSLKSDLLLTVNGIIDAFFLFDFLIRFFSFPSKKYFLHGYGWVDLLAALPGLEFLFKNVPAIFKVFKVLRIGRFFKIIRVLRFLRVFKFLKKMKGDSAYIQDRIMKIGVTVVIVLVGCIAVTDMVFQKVYSLQLKKNFVQVREYHNSFSEALKILCNESLVAYTVNGKHYLRSGKQVTAKKYKAIKTEQDNLQVSIGDRESILVFDTDFIDNKNTIMLVLIVSLIVLIIMIIFYIGFVLAKDIKLINLVVDSIDADDYMLLIEEGKKYRNTDNKFAVEDGEEEITSLFKMINKLIIDNNISSEMTMLGMGGDDFSSGMPDVNFDSPAQDASENAYPEVEEESYSVLPSLSDEGEEEPEELEELPSLSDELPDLNIGDSNDEDLPSLDDEPSELSDELPSLDDSSVAEVSEGLPPLDDEATTDNSSSVLEESSMPAVSHTVSAGSEIENIISNSNEKLKQELVSDLTRVSEDTAIHAVKIAAKSIIDYIKKNS
jgi:hypothetical protein